MKLEAKRSFTKGPKIDIYETLIPIKYLSDYCHLSSGTSGHDTVKLFSSILILSFPPPSLCAGLPVQMKYP